MFSRIKASCMLLLLISTCIVGIEVDNPQQEEQLENIAVKDGIANTEVPRESEADMKTTAVEILPQQGIFKIITNNPMIEQVIAFAGVVAIIVILRTYNFI